MTSVSHSTECDDEAAMPDHSAPHIFHSMLLRPTRAPEPTMIRAADSAQSSTGFLSETLTTPYIFYALREHAPATKLTFSLTK